MIYLIRSSRFINMKDHKCKETEVILKIGYTAEDSKKSRFNAYITENPGIQILYLIPNGTKEDERNLHQHFKKYKTNYGREWFVDSLEILEYFRTHTTKKSLQDLNYLNNRERSIIENKYIGKILLHIISNGDISKYNETKEKLFLDIDNVLCTVLDYDNFYKSLYPDVDFNDYELTPDNKDYDFVESFKNEFRQDENFVRRMKMYYRLVTEFSDIYKQHIKIFQAIIPTEYQGYMNLLGPDRIRANGYIESELKKESEAILGKDELRPEILLAFKEGSRYSTKSIKSDLSKIYGKLGINKTAKASDLDKYFETKTCKILNNDTGKWEHGFEIISIKEE